MSSAITIATKLFNSAAGYLRTRLDPGMSHRLDAAITAHVLDELPRLVRLLDEREADIRASGCTPEEANIIAHQVFETQKRTLDEGKRQRLSNVLVNGLCAPKWNKVRLRFLVRLTGELEEEHIDLLLELADKEAGRTREDILMEDEKWIRTQLQCGAWTSVPTPALQERFDIQDALTRELISLGLVRETPIPQVRREYTEEWGRKGEVDDVELNWETELSPLGRALLDHLRDPEGE